MFSPGTKVAGEKSFAEPRVMLAYIPKIPIASIRTALKIAAMFRIHLLSLILKQLTVTTAQMNTSCHTIDENVPNCSLKTLPITSVKSTASDPIHNGKLI